MKRALLMLLLTGCYHVRFDEVGGTTTTRATRVVTPFTDIQAPVGKGVPCEAGTFECQCTQQGHGLVNVRVSGNYGYSLLSVFTLGIVNLVDLEYACAPQTGEQPFVPPTP